MCVLTATKTDMRVEYLPVATTETGITLARDDEKSAILEAFRARSRAIRDEQEALRLWDAFCTADKQSYYLTCVRSGFTDESDPTGFNSSSPTTSTAKPTSPSGKSSSNHGIEPDHQKKKKWSRAGFRGRRRSVGRQAGRGLGRGG